MWEERLLMRTRCHLAEGNYKRCATTSPDLGSLKQSTHGNDSGHGRFPEDELGMQSWPMRGIHIGDCTILSWDKSPTAGTTVKGPRKSMEHWRSTLRQEGTGGGDGGLLHLCSLVLLRPLLMTLFHWSMEKEEKAEVWRQAEDVNSQPPLLQAPEF